MNRNKDFNALLAKSLISTLLLLHLFTVFGQDDRYLWTNLSDRYQKREVNIRMRDGIQLFTVILEPLDKSKAHPFMMERTCYNASDKTRNLRVYAPYVNNNYILVFQDVRGRNRSEGIFEDSRPFIEDKIKGVDSASASGKTDEASDTYDTVEWLLGNVDNNNGRVGVKGISYPGFYATMAALSGHPAIKAVSPQAPVGDWFIGDDYHHNGAFMLADIIAFDLLFEYENAPEFRNISDKPAQIPQLIHTDIYNDYLELGTFKNILEKLGPRRFFLDSCRAHPDYDEFWDSRAVVNGHLHDIQPAVMVVGGLFDKEDCFGALATYNGIRNDSPTTELYLVEGPWFHGAWTRKMGRYWDNLYFGEEATEKYYFENIEYPFFAWYLEDKGTKLAEGALVFDSGSRKMIQYPSGWPLVPLSGTTPFYLDNDGTISKDHPDKEGKVNYISDPSHPVPYRAVPEKSVNKVYMIDDQRFAVTRPDVLCFTTEPLKEEMTLRGEIEADLFVDISSTDADFIVKVIDVFPDDFSWKEEAGVDNASDYPMAGYQLMLRGEVFRGKYRNSFSSPEPFESGRTTRVRFKMNDVSHTLKPGHRLMIQIQSSWFPLVDRNPQTFCNIYECDADDYVKAQINIHCGGDSASCIRLPLVK